DYAAARYTPIQSWAAVPMTARVSTTREAITVVLQGNDLEKRLKFDVAGCLDVAYSWNAAAHPNAVFAPELSLAREVPLRLQPDAAVIGAGLWTACSASSRDLLGPSAATPALTRITPDFRAALAAQKRHTPALLRVPGIVGTAIGLAPDGKPTVRLLLAQPNVTGLPLVLDGAPVSTEVTGMFFVRSDPTKRQRPAPLGFSVGHPAI